MSKCHLSAIIFIFTWLSLAIYCLYRGNVIWEIINLRDNEILLTNPGHGLYSIYALLSDSSVAIDFMRIPKTGGTSMKSDLANFGIVVRTDEETRWNTMKESPYLFTVLRDPNTHLVSMYKHCKDSIHRKRTKGTPREFNASFADWIHDWASAARNHSEFDCNRHLFRKQCRYRPNNYQSRVLSVLNESEVRERIYGLFAVGIQDMYRETLCVLSFKIHRKRASQCVCNSSFGVHHKRHGVATYDPWA